MSLPGFIGHRLAWVRRRRAGSWFEMSAHAAGGSLLWVWGAAISSDPSGTVPCLPISRQGSACYGSQSSLGPCCLGLACQVLSSLPTSSEPSDKNQDSTVGLYELGACARSCCLFSALSSPEQVFYVSGAWRCWKENILQSASSVL